MMVIVTYHGRFMFLKKQQGFALLSVLLVTALLTMVFIHHFSTIRLQQRLLVQDYQQAVRFFSEFTVAYRNFPVKLL